MYGRMVQCQKKRRSKIQRTLLALLLLLAAVCPSAGYLASLSLGFGFCKIKIIIMSCLPLTKVYSFNKYLLSIYNVPGTVLMALRTQC